MTIWAPYEAEEATQRSAALAQAAEHSEPTEEEVEAFLAAMP